LVEKRNNSASPFPTCAVSMGMAHHPYVLPSQGQAFFASMYQCKAKEAGPYVNFPEIRFQTKKIPVEKM